MAYATEHPATTRPTVLVTGGTGFLGAHCLLALDRAGYAVRTTVRSAGREPVLRELLAAGGAPTLPVQVVEADLTREEGWLAAVTGCRYVLHVASPFPGEVPKDPQELIVPAREGTLRVLRAARRAGVQRVVLTSSFAAIGYGHGDVRRPFTEADWSDVGGNIGAYPLSKTLAERAAWDLVRREGGVELAVVNPVAILGPVLGPDYSTSIALLRRMLRGDLPGLPKISFGIVDVRDVAELHVLAMTAPEAAGERFLAVAGRFMSVADIAAVLRARLGPAADRVSTRVLPNWLVRLAALRDASIRPSLAGLGRQKSASNAKARELLGWQPRPNEEAIVATAESLMACGQL